MKRLPVVILALLAVLAIYLVSGQAGAGDRSSPDAGGAQPTASADPTAGEAPEEDMSASPTPTTSAPGAAGFALTLEGEGLRLFDVETGSARPIPFGTAADLTRSAVTASTAAEVAEEGESFECNARYVRLNNGLTLWLRQDGFAGWSLRDPDPPLTTASGIGIGSSRAELESVYDVRIFESSLGVEFTAGGLAGLLDSGEPGGRVLYLWAGETCIAR